MIKEGKFGPGTKKDLKLKDKNWKGFVGAIENKNRPEAVYIVINTWVKPKLSVLKAKNIGSSEPEELAVEISKEFDRTVDTLRKKVTGLFDSDYFDTSSIIFTYEFAASRASVGKTQFLEIEINIDTVNEIDDDGNPIPGKTGKTDSLNFKQFEKPVTDAMNKLLKMDVFARSQLMTFHKTKGGK